MHNYEDTPDEVIAHFSPQELEVLTMIQGGDHKDERTGLASFAPLLKILMHPEVTKNLHTLKNFRPKEEGIGKLIADQGRFGDSKAAVLPRPIAELFDEIMNKGEPSINPHTGKREYWGLSDLFGGIKNVVSSVLPSIGGLVSKAAPMIGGLAQEGISKLGNMAGMGDLGNQVGSAIGGAVNNIASSGGQSLQNGSFDPTSFLKNAAGQVGTAVAPLISQGIQTLAPMAGNAAQGGLAALAGEAGIPPELTDSIGGLVNKGVTSLGNMAAPVAGDLVRHLSNNLMGGSAPTEGLAQAGMTSSGNQVLNNYGNTPVGAGVGTALTSGGAGMSPQESMMTGTQAGINQMQNPLSRAAAQGGFNSYNAYRNGASPMNSVRTGLGMVDPELRTAAQNQGLNIMRNMGRRAFNRQSRV